MGILSTRCLHTSSIRPLWIDDEDNGDNEDKDVSTIPTLEMESGLLLRDADRSGRELPLALEGPAWKPGSEDWWKKSR